MKSIYGKLGGGTFEKIIAFEPDKENYRALEKRIERLCAEWNIRGDKIELYPYGVGKKTEKKLFIYGEDNGLSSKFIDFEEKICSYEEESIVVSLDEFLKGPCTFLKADIEGFEYKMLLGAKEMIQKYKPILAICIYHNEIDLYSIPLLIKELVPEYKMAVHHHSCAIMDSVFYAWIEE